MHKRRKNVIKRFQLLMVTERLNSKHLVKTFLPFLLDIILLKENFHLMILFYDVTLNLPMIILLLLFFFF